MHDRHIMFQRADSETSDTDVLFIHNPQITHFKT